MATERAFYCFGSRIIEYKASAARPTGRATTGFCAHGLGEFGRIVG
jgi:hypothetical protein